MKVLSFFLSLFTIAAHLSVALSFHPKAVVTSFNSFSVFSRHRTACGAKRSEDRRGESINEFSRPPNEFSRIVSSDKLSQLQGKSQRQTGSARKYAIDIEATPEECKALAKRFKLSDIAKLTASISLESEKNGVAKYDSSGVIVQGSIFATVTQTCVRTNDDFEVNVEFPLCSVVRAVKALGPAAIFSDRKEVEVSPGGHSQRDDTFYSAGDTIDAKEMEKLQSMLQDMEQQEVEIKEDQLMEDEAIYTQNGPLDVGELVAQLFYLQLDPYPKKPGSEKKSYTISG